MNYILSKNIKELNHLRRRRHLLFSRSCKPNSRECNFGIPPRQVLSENLGLALASWATREITLLALTGSLTRPRRIHKSREPAISQCLRVGQTFISSGISEVVVRPTPPRSRTNRSPRVTRGATPKLSALPTDFISAKSLIPRLHLASPHPVLPRVAKTLGTKGERQVQRRHPPSSNVREREEKIGAKGWEQRGEQREKRRQRRWKFP